MSELSARDPRAPASPTAIMLLVSAVAAASVVAFKMLVVYDAFPGWGSDPTVADGPLGVAVTPGLHLKINALLLLLSAGVIGLSSIVMPPSRARGAGGLLLAGGLGVLAWWIGASPVASLDDWLAGSDLAAAFGAGTAMASIPRESPAHRSAAGLLLGVVIVVAAKGALQYFVEHDQTVAAYRAARDQILASNGWAEGSANALAYERRLLQREATGWFGLSNVFATVMAGGALAMGGLALQAPRGKKLLLALGSTAALAGLAMSQSKGGTVAFVVGLGALGVLTVLRRRSSPVPRWMFPAGTVLIAAAGQAAIVARGVVGERLGELSLLFRWFYVQGAARIWGDHAVLGVGPSGFKDAYMMAKPPLSPEDVASPHSLPWDLLATLGLGGAALLVLWILWIWWSGRALGNEVSSVETAASPQTQRESWLVPRLVSLGCAVAIIGSVWVERGATSGEAAIVKIASLLFWALLAGGIARGAVSLAVPLAAASAALTIHGQIEMTPIWTGSGSWFMAVIGLSACARSPSGVLHPSTRTRGLALALGGVAACLLAVGAVAVRLPAVSRWTALMEGSASRVLAVTRLRDAISRAAAQATDEREQRELIREAIDASGVDIPRDADGPAIESAIERASRQSWGEALAELREAAATLPSHAATLRTVSQLALRCVDPKAGDRSAEFVACALKESAQAALLERQQASSLAWSATVRLGIIAQGVPLPNGVTAGALLEEARRALVSAAQQDPYNALHPTQLARLEAGAGNAGAAASWAAKALELDRLGRLDPLKMMDDRTRAELERLAKGATKGD